MEYELASSGALIEAAPDAIVVVTADGRIVLVNAQAERLFGYTRTELLGRSVDRLVPDEHREVHSARRATYFIEARPRAMGAGMRLAGQRKDGSRFPAEISLSVVEILGEQLVAAAVRDVSDRVRAEEKFRGLLEAAPDAIVGVDAAGTIVLANAQAERLFGYARAELLGRPVEMLVPEPVRGTHPRHRRRYLDHPQPRPMGQGLALSGRRKDGSHFPAEISLSAIRTEDGLIVSAAVRDATERQRAAEVSNQLASIVQSSHDAIMGKTLDGIITSWNPGAEKLYGYTAQEMIGQPADILFPVDERDTESTILSRIANGDQVEQYQTTRLRKDGTQVMVSLTMSPIRDALGNIVGVASASRDVSALRRAEAKFAGLLEAAPDAMVGVARDGTIALVNAQAERLFGYERSELLGRTVEVLVPDASRAVHPSRRSRYFANPEPRPMGAGAQLLARRKDGTEFPAEIALSALDTEDGTLVSASIRDVSERLEAQAERERLKAQAEREKLEAQLHQSQRLESLGQLAGGVAHDFNNLLAVILNYAEFVATEVSAAAQDHERDPRLVAAMEDIGHIQRAGERASDLTHQLLAFGRREVVRLRVLNLNDVVTDIQALLRRTLGEHIELICQLGSELWPILADPGQLEQILVNLAVNARDAMPMGGTLRIETANVEHRGGRPGLDPGRYVRLVVADTGTGMPPDVIEHVFEPFYTTKPKGEGTGLGLATVYGIVSQAEGHIEIASHQQAGTTFTVLLPATDRAPVDPEPTAVPARRSTTGTVLLVEDEDALREVTRRILVGNGFDVLVAGSGPEAVKIAQGGDGPIDLVLTDVIMPQMLGKEVAAAVREIYPSTPVLYMSGYAHGVLTSQGRLDPGITLVTKPFSAGELIDKIRETLDQAAASDP